MRDPALQLYTVRQALHDHPGQTLRRVAEIGFREVELWWFDETVREHVRAVEGAGLTIVSAHARLFEAHRAGSLRPLLATARELGIGTLIEPYTEPERWSTRGGVLSLADELNAISRAGQEAGVIVGYHNHNHELSSHIDGLPALEVFSDALDPSVTLEVDVYWVEAGGASATDVLRRLGDRVSLMHVKDGPRTIVPEDQTAVGSGDLPIEAILRTAPHAIPIVELDDTRGDMFAAVAESYRFLHEDISG